MLRIEREIQDHWNGAGEEDIEVISVFLNFRERQKKIWRYIDKHAFHDILAD